MWVHEQHLESCKSRLSKPTCSIRPSSFLIACNSVCKHGMVHGHIDLKQALLCIADLALVCLPSWVCISRPPAKRSNLLRACPEYVNVGNMKWVYSTDEHNAHILQGCPILRCLNKEFLGSSLHNSRTSLMTCSNSNALTSVQSTPVLFCTLRTHSGSWMVRCNFQPCVSGAIYNPVSENSQLCISGAVPGLCQRCNIKPCVSNSQPYVSGALSNSVSASSRPLVSKLQPCVSVATFSR